MHKNKMSSVGTKYKVWNGKAIALTGTKDNKV